jgi:hypothetical protein
VQSTGISTAESASNVSSDKFIPAWVEVVSLRFEPGLELRVGPNAFLSCTGLVSISLTASVEIVLGFKHCARFMEVPFE